MPVVLDYSQVALSVLVQDISQGNAFGGVVDENFIRHMIINTVRSHAVKARPIGELILACDNKSNWRKQAFKNYKAGRAAARDESSLDWDMILRTVSDVRDELKEYFPLKVIRVPEAEADDIIARIALTQKRVHIISGDKDFQQLQTASATSSFLDDDRIVTQYSPTLKKDIVCEDPAKFLAHHVLKGDDSDGVPTILSPDDYFVTRVKGDRQITITAKMSDEWHSRFRGHSIDPSFFSAYEAGEIWQSAKSKGVTTKQLEANVARNFEMIDLTRTPAHVKASIDAALLEPIVGDVSKAMSYMFARGMNRLVENVADFA